LYLYNFIYRHCSQLGSQEKAHRLLDNQICAVAMFLMMFEARIAGKKRGGE
jgi:hypothetical protein